MMRFNCKFICLVTLLLFLYLIMAIADVEEKINRPLILTATKNPLARDANLTVVNAGIVEKIVLGILSESLNFTYVVSPPSDILAAGTLLSNGSWTGATGQLQQKVVDMYVSTTAPTPARRLVVDISNPIFFVETAIIIPFPPEENYDDILYLAFQPKTWIGTGISFSFIVLSAYVINRLSNQTKFGNKSQDSLNFLTLFFIGVLTSQGTTLRNSTTPFRLMCGVSFLGMFIITNYYTGSFTSIISIPQFNPIVKSIEELANSKTVKALLVQGSSTDEYFMLTNDPTYKKIGDQMRQFPQRRILNAFTVDDISTVVKDDYVLIISKPTAESLIIKSFQINGNCRVTMAEKTFYGRGQSFSYPKNSPLTKIVDRKILLMQQFGLISYAAKRAANLRRNPCLISDVKPITNVDDATVRMKLRDITEAFIVLAFGCGLAALTFLVEILIKETTSKRKIITANNIISNNKRTNNIKNI